MPGFRIPPLRRRPIGGGLIIPPTWKAGASPIHQPVRQPRGFPTREALYAFLSKRQITGGTGNLLFFDSADHYDGSQIDSKWTSSAFASQVAARTNNGWSLGASASLRKTLDAEYTSLCVGFAFNSSGYSGRNLTIDNVRTGMPQVGISQVGDGRLQFFMDSGGLVTSVIPGLVLNTNAWYYFETLISISGSGGTTTGTFSFWINGGDNPLASGVTLTRSFTSPDGSYNYCDVSINGSCTVDDCYITDGENLGDIRIYCIFPNAAGDLTQWTPNPGPNNYAMVNEHVPDDGTTLVSTSTINDEDLYNLDDITGFSGTIKGLQALWRAQKSDGGPASFKGELKSSGTTVQTGEFFPSYKSWIYFISPYRKSPFTSSDWGTSEINALQQGQIRIS